MPPAEPAGDDAVRFLDILTTASSIAHARGAGTVVASHVLEAVAMLTGEAEFEEGGGPVSPLGRPRAELAVDPLVRDLMQRWFAQLGGVAEAALDEVQVAELQAEIEELVRS